MLLLGETGTGKSLVARALHQSSPLARAPFLVFDCTVVPRDLMEAELFGYERGAFTDAKTAKPGLLEVADGGTLFLDEIGELGLAAQAKLLRVIEDKVVRRLGALADVTVDVRIIAATNRDLTEEVAAGRFRQDLFYRLTVVTLELPPLRVARRRRRCCSRAITSRSMPESTASRRAVSPTMPSTRSSASAGSATCASSRTSSSARC